ncbi:MAG: hypothetical protein AAFO15_01305, partial [Pseudomonadota bacterium]
MEYLKNHINENITLKNKQQLITDTNNLSLNLKKQLKKQKEEIQKEMNKIQKKINKIKNTNKELLQIINNKQYETVLLITEYQKIKNNLRNSTPPSNELKEIMCKIILNRYDDICKSYQHLQKENEPLHQKMWHLSLMIKQYRNYKNAMYMRFSEPITKTANDIIQIYIKYFYKEHINDDDLKKIKQLLPRIQQIEKLEEKIKKLRIKKQETKTDQKINRKIIDASKSLKNHIKKDISKTKHKRYAYLQELKDKYVTLDTECSTLHEKVKNSEKKLRKSKRKIKKSKTEVEELKKELKNSEKKVRKSKRKIKKSKTEVEEL